MHKSCIPVAACERVSKKEEMGEAVRVECTPRCRVIEDGRVLDVDRSGAFLGAVEDGTTLLGATRKDGSGPTQTEEDRSHAHRKVATEGACAARVLT